MEIHVINIDWKDDEAVSSLLFGSLEDEYYNYSEMIIKGNLHMLPDCLNEVQRIIKKCQK